MKAKIWAQDYISYSGYYNVFVQEPGQTPFQAKLVAYHVKESELESTLKYWKKKYGIDTE